MRSLCVLAILVLSTILFAGEEPPEAPPSKVLLRERNVYVPYEKLKETFEKEGRGVFLPYEEFLKLWNAAQPKEKPPEEVKPPADAVISGGSYTGVASDNAVRFEVTYKVRALGKNWSELVLPLRNVAIETATVSDPLAVFAPKGDGYTLVLPKPGEYSLTLAFSVRVDSKPGQRRIEFGIPPTAVSRLELTIPEKDLSVEVTPKMAATTTTPDGASTKVLAFVGNANVVAVTWMPPAGKEEKGKPILIASQATAVKVGERILRIDTAITYRIESNEADTFRIKLPPEMNLLSVKANNMRTWNEDKAKGELVVQLHTPTKDAVMLLLRFERNFDKTPDKLAIAFPQALEALREDGFVTVSSDAGLRLLVESSTGLSQIDARELPEMLRGNNLLASYRYVAHPLALSLKIDTILPQITSTVQAVASIGIEEDTLSGVVLYKISKVGIFTLKLKFPARWDVSSVGDPQTIEDFQAPTDPDGTKTLTVNLKNKAIGDFRLPFKLTASGRAVPGELTLESVQVIGTQQDAGLFGVSAPKAFKLTTGERNKMTSANVALLVSAGLVAQLPQDFDLPLAYTYTAQPASVKITIEKRQTEIRVNGSHIVIVSEPAMEMRHRLEYFIQYAEVDKLAFSVPSTLDDKVFDVKCAGMKEKKKAGETNGRTKWEILLQEKTKGAVVVDIFYKENFKNLEPEKAQDVAIPDIRAEDVNSQQGYIVVRKESALEIQPKATNLERFDPVKLPPELRPTTETGNIYLAYHYVQADRSLVLNLTRHVPQEVSSTLVDLMRVQFVVTPQRGVLYNLELYIENGRAEQFLALKLPAGATVRGHSLRDPPLKKDNLTLLKLPSGPTPFCVRMIYAAPLDAATMGSYGSLDVSTPELSIVGSTPALVAVPVNKIEAELYLPDDYAYMNFGGTLHRRERADAVSNTFKWIDNAVRAVERPPVVGGEMKNLPSAPNIGAEFKTMGAQFDFQMLSAPGTISVTYADRKLFTLLDVLLFIAVFVSGWLLVRRQKFSPLWVCVALIFVPLCWSWLSNSDFAELPRSAYWAGIALGAVFLLLRAKRWLDEYREERIARAPDPFLEDAAVPVTAGAPAAAASETLPEKSEKPEEKKDDRKKKNGGGK